MPITIYLVRHGEAAGSWDNALDPGLSERGADQASKMADRLCQEIPVANLYCSPLHRTRATAWPEQSSRLNSWRTAILDFTAAQTQDAVFVTHFVVINAIIGAMEKSNNVIVFRPDHCSVTKIHVSADGMSLIEKGQEAVTVVK